MRWLVDNSQVLIIAAIVVVSLLQKLKKQRLRSEARQLLDSDEVERTRRVQVEIRRKIAERAGRMAPSDRPPLIVRREVITTREESPPPTTFAPQQPEPLRNIFEELARKMAEAQQTEAARERERMEGEARKQRELAEQRARAEAAQKAAALARAAEPILKEARPESSAAGSREQLLADLREPAGLRRAWLMREILGAPVGLR